MPKKKKYLLIQITAINIFFNFRNVLARWSKFSRKMGGNLVTVNDEKENQWLIETFITSETNFLWIGINDQAVEGEFIWISGEMSNYLNWAEGEPNNNPQQGGEHFGVINGLNNPFKRPVGTWSDAPEQAKLKGIIELKNNQN